MNDTERIIGELQEFKRATLLEMWELKRDIRGLLTFKWKAAGIMGVLVAMVEVAHMYFQVKGN